MAENRVALVTGAAGFCGHHMGNHLLAAGYTVVGLDREQAPQADWEIYSGDITDSVQVQAILNQIKPDVIFHLAALTNPRLEYQELHRVNAIGTLTLLDAARRICPAAVVLIASSSAVYGYVSPEANPITEAQPFHPMNAYAVSKIAQEMIAWQQFAEHALRIVRARAFNLTGPGENASFVTSALARQIAEIEAGVREPIVRVGNLQSVRDFSDVRDIARAYHLLAEQGQAGEVYNICSGQGTSIRQLLDMLLDLSTRRNISVQIDPGRLQATDVPIQIGDPARLHTLTGWVPQISLRQTLKDVLNFWRRRIVPGEHANEMGR